MNMTTWQVPFSPEWEEKRRRRRDGNFVGLLMLSFLVGQFSVSVLRALAIRAGILDVARLGNNGYLVLSMLQYVLYLVVPTLIVALIARRGYNPFPTRRVERGTYVVAVGGGMAFAVLANYAAGLVMSFLAQFGVPYPDFPSTIEPTGMSLLLNVISVAVFPALAEEMAFRGYMLGALRAHSDRMAIVLSAVLFGLVHGNAVQIPFAFLLGLVLGWLVVQTDCIWPAVVLHFANNLTGVLLDWCGAIGWDEATLTGAAFLVYCVTGGLVMLALYVKKSQSRGDLLQPIGGAAAGSKHVSGVVAAPALIISLVVWILTVMVNML